MSSTPYGIHWFRRDLRIAGNRALAEQFRAFEGRCVGLFVFDSTFLDRSDFSHNRFQFFLETLQSLKEELRSLGSDLLVLNGTPASELPVLFDELATSKGLPRKFTFSRDYEPFARRRDASISQLVSSYSIETVTYRDHLLFEPWEIAKPDSTPYKVYSPFARTWLHLFESETGQQRIGEYAKAIEYLDGVSQPEFALDWKQLLGKETARSEKLKDSLADFITANKGKVTVPIPKAGSQVAYAKLQSFAPKIDEYKNRRDTLHGYPDEAHTSQLSPFLKNGSLTVPLIIHSLGLTGYKKKKSGRDAYLSELIWREFYYHVLFHFPDAEKQSLKSEYRDLEWENDPELFEKWKTGTTGFPIVDAAMRELATRGTMHNRARMIVASFLSKDLLIDWRWGEQWFMQQLLDGDLAPNNGGWQWAASTGCDAQPYFRIFNPWLQSKKFDPDGTYIRRFVPELRDIPISENSKLHAPILDHSFYPAPCVDHAAQRAKAIALYKFEEQ